MKKPVIEITAPDVIENTINSVISDKPVTVKEFDFSNSHLIYKGKDLGTMKRLEKTPLLVERINKTIWLVKDSYLSGLIPENIKDSIINTLMGLED
ncbi:MAG: hypothetical protein J5982_03415 [Bacilli bacterium]|nr:hypothetical protein [Bacilli bacterium]